MYQFGDLLVVSDINYFDSGKLCSCRLREMQQGIFKHVRSAFNPRMIVAEPVSLESSQDGREGTHTDELNVKTMWQRRGG